MKRLFTFAASLVLSSPFGGQAEEPKPKVERLNVLVERSKAESSAAPKTEAGPKSTTAPQERTAQPGAPLAAQQPGALRAGGGIASPWGGGKSAAQWYIEQTDKVAQLSAEQKLKIERLFELRDKESQAIQASIATKAQAIHREMSEAAKNKNQEAITKAQKAYQELYAPLGEIAKKSQTSLQEILTVEQKAKLQEHRLTSMITAYAPGVTLSDAQRKQIKEGIGQGGDHEGLERKLPEILGRTLTAEQTHEVLRRRLTTFVTMSFGNAKLTSEQLQQVERRITDLSKDHKQGLQYDPSHYNKVSEFVTGLLTDEQKKTQVQRFGFGGAVVGATINSAQPAGRANPNPAATAPGASPTNPANPTKPTERKQPDAQPNVKVTQLPGGGIQVFITEENESRSAPSGQALKPEQASARQTEEVQRRLQDLMKQAQSSHRDGMRERVRRQRELTKQASKLMKKLDELGSDESPKARDLWQQLTRVQGELQQTLGTPQAFSIGTLPGSTMPGQPAGAWVVQSSGGLVGPGATLLPQRQNQPQPNPQTRRLEAVQITAPTNVALQPAQAEVIKSLEALRRQVEELRQQVRKLSEK